MATDQSAITGGVSGCGQVRRGPSVLYDGVQAGQGLRCYHHSCKTILRWAYCGACPEAKDQGHFKAVMDSIGTVLLVLVIFWILAAWIGGFYHSLGIALPGSQNLLHYALVLLIIGVPVGLPVVTTTTLAVGAAYLAKQKAIVQKLTAIESLAVTSPRMCRAALCKTDVSPGSRHFVLGQDRHPDSQQAQHP